MKKNRIVFLLFLFLSAAGAAEALELKPGGLLFAHYEFAASQHLQNGATSQNYSSFEVSRIYLNLDAKYDEKVSAFLQLEANLNSRENKNNRVFLKNAELRVNLHPAARISGGLVALPWRGFEEGIWKHRFVAKILEDQDIGQNAADRGLRVSGNVPFLAYDAMVSNGEGVGADGTGGNENTNFNGGGRLKDYQAKLTFSPFERAGEFLQNLKVSGLLYKGDRNESQIKNRLFAALSYESKRLNLFAGYYNADNSSPAAPSRGEGFSLHGVLSLTEKLSGFMRFDRYDPDIHAGGDRRNRYIYGASYQLVKGVRLSLNHQYLEQERRSVTRQDESFVFLSVEAKF